MPRLDVPVSGAGLGSTMKRVSGLAVVVPPAMLGVRQLPAANPVLPGADPHAVVVGDTVWLYPTWSEERRVERFFAFSSTNLTQWQRHGPVLDFA